MVDYAGWQMPISYKSPLQEHLAVRKKAGMFDVSHMGEFMVRGKDASAFITKLTTRDVRSSSIHSCQYAGMLNEAGGFIDDLIIYKLSANEYMLCVNAANSSKDFLWIQQQSKAFNDIETENISGKTALIAVQGPSSLEVLEKSSIENIKKLQQQKPFTLSSCIYMGSPCIVAKTGYTGEVGAEIFLNPGDAKDLWKELCDLGAEPCGLAARDSLRLEAGLSLYGKDINAQTTPKETGLSWIIKNQTDFIGSKKALLNLQDKKLVAFKMIDSGIARDQMPVYNEESILIGQTTSATYLPYLEVSGGFAFIDINHINIGKKVWIDIRGKRKLAQIEKRPLYKASVDENK